MKKQIKNWIVNIVLMALTATAAVAIGSNLPHLINTWRGPVKSGDFSSHIEKMPYRLTLYGTSTCPHCHSARAFLKQSGIAYNDILIDQSAEAMTSFKKLKQEGVPVLVSKNKLVAGFDEKAFDAIIKSQLTDK